MSRPRLDCVVIGAGPAGLAMSAALVERRIDHIVLERGRAGQTWRTQRWDSLRLNNPGWMNPMLGDQARDSYLSGSEVVARLERLANASPVHVETPVSDLRPHRGGWRLCAGGVDVATRTVVVATGNENRPRRPAFSRRLPDRVLQLHAAEYRSPAQLPRGAVLVVGSAQSGYQITEELLAAGRRVTVATSPAGRAPARHRGRDTVEWLAEAGFFDQRRDDLTDPSVVRAAQPLLAPGGRSASLQALARLGATLAGRLTHIDGDRLTFDTSVSANIASADAFAVRIRSMLDAYIAGNLRRLPPPEPDPADEPVRLVDPPTTLDLRTHDVGSVIWCTGYSGDFSWLDAALTDDGGQPRHRAAAAPLPGLWYVGLRWLTRRSSGNFLGFPADAAAVGDSVARALRAADPRGGRETPAGRLDRPFDDARQRRRVRDEPEVAGPGIRGPQPHGTSTAGRRHLS